MNKALVACPDPRDEGNDAKAGFDRALGIMGRLYASPLTRVVQLVNMPPKMPDEFAGGVLLCSLAESVQWDGAMIIGMLDTCLRRRARESRYRDELPSELPSTGVADQIAGDVILAHVAPVIAPPGLPSLKVFRGNAFVKFKSHEDAERAVAAFGAHKTDDMKAGFACTWWNARKYGPAYVSHGENEPGRGWCVFEECASKLCVAYEHDGMWNTLARGRTKCCDISPCDESGKPPIYHYHPHLLPQSPRALKAWSEALIHRTLKLYEPSSPLRALFTGGGDQETVSKQLEGFSAMLDALAVGKKRAKKDEARRERALRERARIEAKKGEVPPFGTALASVPPRGLPAPSGKWLGSWGRQEQQSKQHVAKV